MNLRRQLPKEPGTGVRRLASRLTYPCLFPLLLAHALKLTGPSRVLRHLAIAGLTLALLTLPVYL